MNLKYRIANINEADRLCYIVQHTKEVIYPDYYSQAVVDFFGKLHSIDNIKKDIEQGRNGVLFLTAKSSEQAVTPIIILQGFMFCLNFKDRALAV